MHVLISRLIQLFHNVLRSSIFVASKIAFVSFFSVAADFFFGCLIAGRSLTFINCTPVNILFTNGTLEPLLMAQDLY